MGSWVLDYSWLSLQGKLVIFVGCFSWFVSAHPRRFIYFLIRLRMTTESERSVNIYYQENPVLPLEGDITATGKVLRKAQKIVMKLYR